MTAPVADIQRIADRYLRSEASAAMTVMELVQLTEDPVALAATLPMLASSVCPYSLGSAELLATATSEVVISAWWAPIFRRE